MNSTVYFFDHMQKLIKRKNANSLIEATQEKEITADKSELMNDVLFVTTVYDKTIEDARFMAVRENKNSFSLYRITKTNDPENNLEFTGVSFAPDELDAYVIGDIRPNGQPAAILLNRLMEFTDGNWRIDYTEATLPIITTNFYYVTVREALKELQTFGMEFVFRCSLDSSGVKDKWIEVYRQIGEHSNMRFTYGNKALSVVKEVDRSSIATSIIGRGRGEEVGDGYGRRIEFSDIEWRKSNGDPLDKPKGQNWLEDPESTKKYGIPQKDGSMRKRENVVVFDDIEDPALLLKNTYDILVDASRPLAQFKAEVTGSDAIGNVVTIHRHDKNYHYQTRIYKTTLNRLTGETSIELGDNLTKDTRKQTSSIVNNINSLESSKMTFYESTEIGKYQDDIMRGAGTNGGSVYWVNGIEAGVSDSREVYETVYMDGPGISSSHLFMVQNNSGISFKQCNKGEWKTIQDVHNGKSTTAWTLDGVFNANFIQAGILSGILVQGVALKTLDDQDFQVVVVGGKVSFEKKVISTGLDDVHGESLGSIVSTYGSQGINGFAIWKEPGYIFSINAGDTNGTSKPVFQLPSDCTANKRKYNLYGEGTFDEGDITFRKKVTFQSDVMIGDKTLENYIKQFAGQGGGSGGGNGGSWNGQYPPEITSDRDKRYWQIWAMAIGAGFTQQAAAALLGNAQGESDANPTADEGNGAPGFGYGVWQWTDSTGASSGRVYMINLMTQAGITENPDTITAQFQLLMWHAPNGQWMATNAYPYTWTQFMGLTDIATATRAFEKNFERPLNDHPERVGWSTNWYNRFKDLSIPQSAGYITPISAPIRVTSEFGWRTSPITGAQEFHNGIDLVNNNPNTPIFASSEGEVIVAGAEYFSWYGNYVVIRHSDGIYTGYAHLSRVDVSVGQKVSQGQQLGLMGTTGPSTGEHLHFQFMDEFYPSSNARFHNPRNYINF